MAVEGTAPANPAGGRIGKYEILAKIGQGAMGEVFKARDTVLGRFVAIKTMSAAVLGDAELGQRFLREAQSAARLNHPNIVTLHEFGEDAGRVFMALELLEGEDLKDLLRRGGLPTLDDKLVIMEQTLDGVAYAHDAGVIHRDLKPANIHVQPNGRVKVMDFGLARLGESEMTRAGTVMGTPNYMSPEQVRGERAGPPSDVFSLGAVFYEVISGRRAFEADSMHAVLYKVTDSDPVPLGELCPDLPPILELVIGKALAKDVELRYHNGAEMRAAFEVCRGVLDGTLDEETAIASLRQTATIIQRERDTLVPDGGTVAMAAPTQHGGTTTRRGTPGQPGSSALTRAGTLTAPRRGTRIGSRPGSRPGSSPSTPSRQRIEGAHGGPAAPSSRVPLLAGAAVLGAGIIAAALFFALRRPPAAVPTPGPEAGREEALVGMALTAQLEAARRSLEFKDFVGAIEDAGKALELDPANAEAREISRKAQARLDEVEAAATAARKAAQAGDVDAASEALARVLALAPKHPVAGELSGQLDSRFRARADAASRSMKAEAEAARRAGASSLRAYSEAAGLVGRAEAAYARRQYTEAAQKFAEAERAYVASRAEAQALAARATPRPAVAAVASAAPPPVVAPPTLPPPTLPPATLPPATLAPPPTPAPTQPAKPVVSDEAAVRQLLANLERAIEEKDLALYKRLRPGLPAEDERRLKDAFQNVASQQVDYAIESISLDGDKASLRVTRSGRVSGQAVPPVRQVIHLVRGENGWVIADIGQ